MRRKRSRTAMMAAVVLVVGACALLAHDRGALRWLELQTIDARFSVRGEQPAPKGVAVVAVDAQTFNERPADRWPFLRRRHAQAIRILEEAGAQVIVYDVQFTEPSNPDDDGLLYDAIYRAGNVVLGTSEIAKGGKTRILGSDKNVRAARARPASAQYDLDPNGVIRRIPYATDGLKTMPVVAYERAFGHPPDRAGFKPKGAWIDFSGPPLTVPTLSFSRLLAHRFPADFFRHKIVVVGASAPSLQDVHPVSTSGRGEMSGPEIQASAIHTLEEGIPLRSVPNWVDLLLIVLMAFIPPLAGLRLGAIWTMGIAIGGIAVFLVGAQVASENGHVVAVTYPILASIISLAGVI